MGDAWTIFLLGSLRACRVGQTVTRFRTQKTAALLARLAYPPQRPHAREELAGWLWPDACPEDGRRSLRVALNSLRRQLEPPSVPAGSILQADHFQIALNFEFVSTDVRAWETCLRAAERAPPEERRTCLTEAVTHYGGPLLPGFYDEWVLTERERLTQAYVTVLMELAEGDDPAVLDYALRAVTADPLREDAHARVIQLHMAAGRVAEARRQFAECKRLLAEELNTEPGESLQALLTPAGSPSRSPKISFGQRAPETRQPQTDVPTAGVFPPTPSGTDTLPMTFTRFFGRQEELSALTVRLEDPRTRLLTVTGPGGVGKTRLAIESARHWAASEGHAAFFAPLAEVSDPFLLPTTLLTALGEEPDAARNSWEQIKAGLCRQPTLLVLDNFEQVLPDGVGFVQKLLYCVPTLTCLVTSRQRLGLEAELEYPLQPLPVPKDDLPLEQIGRQESVALFVERAQTARSDFQVTASNAPAVAELVRRLEGIPLALELAAARARSLTPHQMVTELEQRFAFLTSRRRLGAERHFSLWATLDWSYRLLSPQMQRFFRELSVFRGGWTAEAAEAVCQEANALSLLEHLQDCSLVKAVEEADVMRFSMLDTLREFGREHLDTEEAALLRRRHADWCLQLAEEAEAECGGGVLIPKRNCLLSEQDNLRAALEWSREQQWREPEEIGLRLACALPAFWLKHGLVLEGHGWLEDALSASEQAFPSVRAKLLQGGGRLALFQNQLSQARVHFEQCLALWRKSGDLIRIAEVCLSLGHLRDRQDGPEAARPFFAESLRLCRLQGSPVKVSQTLAQVGSAAISWGQIAEGRPLLEERLALHRSQGQPVEVGRALSGVASVALRQGDYRQAQALLIESLAALRTASQPIESAACLATLGQVAFLQGDLMGAHSFYQESLANFQAGRHQVGTAGVQESLGMIAETRGDWAQAHALYESSLDLWQRLGNSCGICRVLGARLGGLAVAHEDYEEAQRLREQCWERGRQSGNSLDVAIGACDLAEVAAMRGEYQKSQSLRADSFAAVCHWPPSASLAALQDSLGRVALEEGNAVEAQALHMQTLAVYRSHGLKPEIAQALALLAEAMLPQENSASAARWFRESLTLSQEIGSLFALADALEGLAATLAGWGHAEKAARLFGAAAALRDQAGIVLPPRTQARLLRRTAPARQMLGADLFQIAWTQGLEMPLAEALSLAREETR